MYKVLMPLKRKAGMSVEDFRAYYETYHRLIGEKYLKGYATKYLRRYITALPDAQGHIAEPDFDVLLEIWFPNEATFQKCAAGFAAPEAEKEIREDEEKLFDRSHMPSLTVLEYESDMP